MDGKSESFRGQLYQRKKTKDFIRPDFKEDQSKNAPNTDSPPNVENFQQHSQKQSHETWNIAVKQYIQDHHRHLKTVAEGQGISFNEYAQRLEHHMMSHPGEFQPHRENKLRERVRGGTSHGESDLTKSEEYRDALKFFDKDKRSDRSVAWRNAWKKANDLTGRYTEPLDDDFTRRYAKAIKKQHDDQARPSDAQAADLSTDKGKGKERAYTPEGLQAEPGETLAENINRRLKVITGRNLTQLIDEEYKKENDTNQGIATLRETQSINAYTLKYNNLRNKLVLKYLGNSYDVERRNYKKQQEGLQKLETLAQSINRRLKAITDKDTAQLIDEKYKEENDINQDITTLRKSMNINDFNNLRKRLQDKVLEEHFGISFNQERIKYQNWKNEQYSVLNDQKDEEHLVIRLFNG